MAQYDVTTAASSFNFDTQAGLYNASSQIDATHYLNLWSDGNNLFAQVMAVNTSTWAVTTSGAKFTMVSSGSIEEPAVTAIDANHFIVFFTTTNSDGFVQVITVNTTTWAVTTANTALEFDTQNHFYPSCFKVDTNHFINFWSGITGNDGAVQIFTVNTTTWAVTTAGARLGFVANAAFNSCAKIDDTHFINFWSDVSSTLDGFCQIFTINTTTWAVTTANSAFEFDAVSDNNNSCSLIDANHVINFWIGDSTDAYAGIFTVNTTTWAITTASTYLDFDPAATGDNFCVKIDDNHYINFWEGSGNDGFVQTFEINTTTWAVTTKSTALEFDTTLGQFNAPLKVDTSHYINFWRGGAGIGYSQIFQVEGAAAGPANLKTYNTNAKANIKTINTNPIANIKSLNTNV